MLDIKSTDKICIIRSAFLGDWITTVPFYIYLLNDCMLNKENISTVILNNKGINPVEIILGQNSILSKNTYVINSRSIKVSLKTAFALRKKLYGKFDKIIFLPFTLESKLSRLKKYIISFVIAEIGIERYGFNLLRYEKNEIPPSQYVSYFKKLGITFNLNTEKFKNFLISESVKIRNHEIKECKKIAIYAHSKLEMKIWPLHNFILLITELHKKFKANFLLIGSKEDYDHNQQILSKLSAEISIVNIAGVLNIQETMEELSDVDLLIANDGAPVHFASLLNRPVVGLYTFKEPIGFWDPFLSNRYITLRTEVSCKNCFKEFCSNALCIQSISVLEVLNSCIELLNCSNNIIRQNRILFPDIPLNFMYDK